MKPFIITGTGRSGTKWCATVMRLAGYRCGHEQVFKTEQLPEFGDQEWEDFEGDSSLAAAPFLHRWFDSRKVLVVRHPLSVVASFIHNGPLTEDGQPEGLMRFLHANYPEIPLADSELEAVLRYWVLWNSLAMDEVDVVVKLEDLTPETLLEAVGVEPRWPLFPFDEPVNASVETPITPDSIEAYPRAGELAAQLGYEVLA